MTGEVVLRDVVEGDLPALFEHQLDADATRMAAFPPRDRDAFMAHWAKILGNTEVVTKTILVDGEIAGNIVSFEQEGTPLVGYWIGREYWGKGVATRALRELLGQVTKRPMYAHVAKHNVGSVRVLEKCGFRISREEKVSVRGEEIEELVMVLGCSDSNATRDLLHDAADRAARYLESLPERRVGPSAEAVRGLSAWETELPAGPSEPAEVLRLLDEVGSPATMAMAGGRFFGFVIGGALPATVATSWLATAWDQNSGLHNVTPVTAELERITLEWLVELLGLPAGTAAGFVTGATVANFTALAAARHVVLARAGWNVEADGLFGAPPITVVVGEEVHPTLVKSLGLLGLGRTRVVTVPVDDQGRMRADAFPRLAGPTAGGGPTIVCLQSGNVNSGAFDPAEEIVPLAKEAGAWVHIDGAFGLWAAASPRLAPLAAGLAAADSWATDAHKWLNVPYDSGLAFVRDGEALRAAMAVRAAYLPTGVRDPSDFTPELSRRGRGVEVWAALRALGRSGLAEMLDRTCRHARRFAEGLAAAGYEVLNEVVLNQVLVSFGSPEVTRQVIAGIQEDGTCWCGGTVWQGKTAMRISVCSWATSDEDVERSLEAMVRVAGKVA